MNRDKKFEQEVQVDALACYDEPEGEPIRGRRFRNFKAFAIAAPSRAQLHNMMHHGADKR